MDVSRVRTPAGDPAWRIAGYEGVKQLLADPRLGRFHRDPDNAPRYSDALIFGRPTQGVESAESEQAQLQMMRGLLTRSFSARRLEHLKPRVNELVDVLLDSIEQLPQPVDLHDRLSFTLSALVICEMLGVPPQDREAFRRWSDQAADMTDEKRARAGNDSLIGYMTGLTDRKRAEPGEDVVSDLVEAQQFAPEGVFTDEHVANLAAGLLFAGYETSGSAIDRGIGLLLTHPEQLAALRRDPELLPSAVEEILRLLYSADARPTGHATGLSRYANADIDVGGAVISSGDLVLLDLGDANVEPEVFDTPETFDITRQPNPHLTFGHGPRFCVGAPLARIELQAVFPKLFTRFPQIRLAVPSADLRPRSHLLAGGLDTLPVIW